MFDWPIGTPEERAVAFQGLPGSWVNSNPFGNYYEISPGVWNYHDGVDLNLNVPNWNADYHKPIRAIADGQVIFAGVGGGSWGHIVVINHDLPDGSFVVSRFGHVELPIVKTGDHVVRGQQVANVGDADGYYKQTGAHLHWNISKSGDPIMLITLNQWCGINKQCVLTHYTDPIQFVIARKMPEMLKDVTIQTPLVSLYQTPSLTAPVTGAIPVGTATKYDDATATRDEVSGFTFYRHFTGNWFLGLAAGLPDVVVAQDLIGYVSKDGDGLRVRSAPATTATILKTLTTGDKVEYTADPPTQPNNFVKVVKINDVAVLGYCSLTYLQPTRPQ